MTPLLASSYTSSVGVLERAHDWSKESVPWDRLCGLVVRVLATDAGVPGSIPGHYKKSSGSGKGSTQPREYN
jgi:hypothetical protein